MVGRGSGNAVLGGSFYLDVHRGPTWSGWPIGAWIVITSPATFLGIDMPLLAVVSGAVQTVVHSAFMCMTRPGMYTGLLVLGL